MSAPLSKKDHLLKEMRKVELFPELGLIQQTKPFHNSLEILLFKQKFETFRLLCSCSRNIIAIFVTRPTAIFPHLFNKIT